MGQKKAHKIKSKPQKSHREEYEPFLEDGVPFDDYCKNMRESSTWAGHMELQVISLVTHTNICIHKLSSPRWHIQNFESTKSRCIHLSYHNGEHYNSVRRKDDCGGGPAKSILLEMPVLELPKGVKGKAAQNKKSSHIQPSAEAKKNEEVFWDLQDDGADAESFYADLVVTSEQDVDNENLNENCTTKPSPQVQRVARNKVCPCGSKKKYKACCGAATPSNRAQEIARASTEGLSNKARKQKLRINKGVTRAQLEGVAAAKEVPDMGFLCI